VAVHRAEALVMAETSPTGTVQEPSLYYSYTVEDPNTIKATVMAGAGAGRV
jgi:pectate lyase